MGLSEALLLPVMSLPHQWVLSPAQGLPGEKFLLGPVGDGASLVDVGCDRGQSVAAAAASHMPWSVKSTGGASRGLWECQCWVFTSILGAELASKYLL